MNGKMSVSAAHFAKGYFLYRDNVKHGAIRARYNVLKSRRLLSNFENSFSFKRQISKQEYFSDLKQSPRAPHYKLPLYTGDLSASLYCMSNSRYYKKG